MPARSVHNPPSISVSAPTTSCWLRRQQALVVEQSDKGTGVGSGEFAGDVELVDEGGDAEARAEAGILDSLVRLSVGLEAEGDLIEDLSGALEHATGLSGNPSRSAVAG